MSKTMKSLISVLTLLMFVFVSNLAFANSEFQKLGIDNVSGFQSKSLILMNDDEEKGDGEEDDRGDGDDEEKGDGEEDDRGDGDDEEKGDDKD